jgi:hypothetical protein
MKVRICKNEQDAKAGIGKVFNIDVSIPDLADVYDSTQVDKWTEYGFRVWLQKDIGEANKKKFGGRDAELVSKELTAKGIPFTVTDWEKNTSSEVSALIKEFAGLSIAQIQELVSSYKAAKEDA